MASSFTRESKKSPGKLNSAASAKTNPTFLTSIQHRKHYTKRNANLHTSQALMCILVDTNNFSES